MSTDLCSNISKIMMMINCFCGIVDQLKVIIRIFNWDHCQSFSPSETSNTLQAGFEPF